MDWSEVEAERLWRDELYRGDDTPLSPEARERYRGLVWFPLDERYVVRSAKLKRYPQPKPANLPSTGDDPAELFEVGLLEFELLGHQCRLLAFEPAPGEAEEHYILIPFRDGTTANDTYGAGRYMDVEPREDDVYTLDFNRAYHPYCAHDDAWSCTLPPPENRLPMRVEAGERLP